MNNLNGYALTAFRVASGMTAIEAFETQTEVARWPNVGLKAYCITDAVV